MKKAALALTAFLVSVSCLQSSAWSTSSLLLDMPAIVSKAPRISGSFTLADNVIDIGKNSVSNIVDISKTATGEMQIRLSGAIAESLQVGKILYIPPDTDSRFPVGFSGKVISYVVNTDGTKTVVLGDLSLVESIKEGRSDISNITLDTSNLVGIITPSAVQFTSPALEKVSNSSKGNFYVLRDEYVQKQERLSKIAEQQNVIVTPEPILLDSNIELGSMGIDASRMSPVAGSSSVGFEVKGSFDKIKYTEDYEINGLKLNQLNLRLDGELDFDVKFNGKGSVTFGYFSRAWNEVEDQAFNFKISSGKIIGLSSEDKQGKFPLAGLVFSVKCPPEKPCLSYLGQTQTPVRNAKELGVIVWISLVLKGEYSVAGDLSLARLHPANISLGIKKTPDNKFELTKSVQRVASSGRLLEAPVFNGEFNAKATAGIAADIDFFALNIRVANAGMNLVAQSNFSAKGTASYGTDRLDGPWSWQTDACFTRGIGAGAVFGGAVNFGINFDDSSWIKSDIDPLSYSFQIPKNEEMELPGWHGAWYYAKLTDTCVPTVTSTTGRTWMDRDLGASRAATSMTDAQSYGDLYQWGRGTDGHEKRTSGTTETLSSSDSPGHGKFIMTSSEPHDWRDPQNENLWQGVSGVNNPCPAGFRVPTVDEWQEEIDSWAAKDTIGAFASPLKLPLGGYRVNRVGSPTYPAYVGSTSFYWSSTAKGYGLSLINNNGYTIGRWETAMGGSVRCIKDDTVQVSTVVSATGRVWMDRNLGASQVATSMTDTAAYGDFYQWGRGKDGHEKRTSGTTATLSSTDVPGHSNFIMAEAEPSDWRNPSNDMLWQGATGTNNPCPAGFRLPTADEWNAEIQKYGPTYDALFNSPLKLPAAGFRRFADGTFYYEGVQAYYWSSTIEDWGGAVGKVVRFLHFNSEEGSYIWSTSARANGFRLRCIKD